MVGWAVVPVAAGLANPLCNDPALFDGFWELGADEGAEADDTGGCCFFFKFSLKHKEHSPSVAGDP